MGSFQKILKPTKYRAIDTSTGEHLSANFVVDSEFKLGGDQSDATSGAYWATGSDVTIDADGGPGGTGAAIFADDADAGTAVGNCLVGWNQGTKKGYGTSPIGDINPGDKFEVTYTVSDYNDGVVRINLFSKSPAGDGNHVNGEHPIYRGSTAAKSENGTFTETIVVDELLDEIDYNNSIVISSASDASSDGNALYKISSISVKKYESFGNNNHGEIYSGRGLEFDGLSDSLTISNQVTHETDWRSGTIATYLYLENTPSTSDRIFSHFSDSNTRFYFALQNNGKLRHQLGDEDLFTDGNIALENKTWYRVVLTWNVDGTVNTYINGVLDKTSTGIELNTTDTNMDSLSVNAVSIGSHNGGANFFDGKMSDFQMWNSTWTQSDVTYDYLNPESLALNNSGTSLTESNLKLWYPMQDGHRGQQSYILDGANTGARELLPAIYQTSSTTNASNWFNNNDSTVVHSDSEGGLVMTGGTSGSSNQYIVLNTSSSQYYANLSENLEEGQTYKLTADIKANAGSGGLKIYGGTTTYATTGALSSSSFVTKELFWTHGSDTVKLQVTGLSTGEQIVVNNISIKAINTKHHATTEFLGEELLTDGTQFNNASTWDFSGADWTSIGTTALYDGDGTSVLKLDKTYPSFIKGRTYRLTINSISGTTIKFSVQDGTGDDTNVLIADATYSIGGFEVDFVAPATTDGLSFIAHADASAFTLNGPMSVKEVGVATGWTEADQQINIPQTALQSYNQLAMPHGKSTSHVAYSDGDSDLKFTTENHSFSFWICPQSSNNAYVFSKGQYHTSGYYVYWGGSTMKLQYQTHQSSANQTNALNNALTAGEWYHAVVAISNNGTKSQWYINGELENSNSSHTASTADTRDFQIYNRGAGSNNPDFGFTELSVFNKTLNQSEVIELYNSGKALDARTHSASTNLLHYWRNNGLAEWTDIGNAGSLFNGTPTNIEETLLIPAGVDASRDTQGFLMNRQRNTNSFNNNFIIDVDTDHSSYNKVQIHPLRTGSAVTNYSISFWMKLHIKPSDYLTSGNSSLIFDTTISTALRAFKVNLNHNNTLYLYTYYGTSSNDYVYSDYDLDNLGNAIQSPPTTPSAGIGEAFDENKWYHVTFTFDHDRTTGSVGSNSANTNTESHNFTPVKLYINGIQITSEGREGTNSAMTTARSMHDVNVPLIIGSDVGSDGNPTNSNLRDFPGELDDVCFYSDTLTDEEVLRNYKAGKRSHK